MVSCFGRYTIVGLFEFRNDIRLRNFRKPPFFAVNELFDELLFIYNKEISSVIKYFLEKIVINFYFT